MLDQEHEAIGALKRGDIAGLHTLVTLHQLRALRTAYRIVGDTQLAQDIVSDAFLAVYEQISKYDDTRPFVSWFYRIVVNRSLNALHRNNRTVRGREATAALFLYADPAPDPESAAANRETRAAVQSALRTLPPKQRAVVVLRYYLDMDEREIAQVVGCPRGTVKWRLFAARHKIEQLLVHHIEDWPSIPQTRRSI